MNKEGTPGLNPKSETENQKQKPVKCRYFQKSEQVLPCGG